MPKVSICIPSRNTRPFLEERRKSIEEQTFQNFEVIVVDDGSIDGSREFFDEWANQDSRVAVYEGPGKGLYPGWNDCILRSTGDYIYIATSDDTMAEDCLEKLVEALDANPDCGLAHCNLKAIGESADQFNALWTNDLLFASSSGDLFNLKHIRKAPYDALLQLTGHTVYISITQLLIRKNIFDEIGAFDGRWGSAGDFHWHMRACFRTNTVHVPDTWGGWRLHASQATSLAEIGSTPHREKIEEMIDDAIGISHDHIPKEFMQGLQSGWRNHFYDKWYFDTMMRVQNSKLAKALFLIKAIIKGSKPARDNVRSRIFAKSTSCDPAHSIVKGWFEGIRHESPLKKV
jgi:glycosyltransferase involved in cell wall biosynthesis